MMPDMKLNTRPVSTSQPPHISAAVRVRSVRGERRDSHSSASRPITAAGISQLAWLPMVELNSRVMPAGPPNAAELRVVGPTEPVSFPVSLPSPL